MVEIVTQIETAPPATSQKLFAGLARAIMQRTIAEGYGFPAVAYSDEDIDTFSQYQVGGLAVRYNTAQYDKAYALEHGVLNDSKRVNGTVSEGFHEMDHISLILLGEGAGIQYGEFGRISMHDSDARYREYLLAEDGTVVVTNGTYDEATDILTYDEPLLVTPEHIAELTIAIESMQVVELEPYQFH